MDKEKNPVVEENKDFVKAEATPFQAPVSVEDVPVSDLSMLENPNVGFFCSMKDDGTRASKAKIYNAINNAEDTVADHINEVLELVDVVAHTIQLPDQNGVIQDCIRTVLVDKNGKCYQAVSEGVVSSLQKIFAIVGKPSWKDEPLKVKIRQVATKNGNSVLKLEMM